MNRIEAKELAKTISAVDLQQMFVNAKKGVPNWHQRSKVNIGMTLGATFNIYTNGKVGYHTSTYVKENMIYEFGEFLSYYEKETKRKRPLPKPFHQEPKELADDFVDPF